MILLQISVGNKYEPPAFLKSLRQEIMGYCTFGNNAVLLYFERKLLEYYGQNSSPIPSPVKSDYETDPAVKKQVDRLLDWISQNPNLLERFETELGKAEARLRFHEGQPKYCDMRMPENLNEARQLFWFWVGVKYAESELPKIDGNLHSGTVLPAVSKLGYIKAGFHEGFAYLHCWTRSVPPIPRVITFGIHECAHASSNGSEGLPVVAENILGLYCRTGYDRGTRFYSDYLFALANPAKREALDLGNIYAEKAAYPWLGKYANLAGNLVQEPKKFPIFLNNVYNKHFSGEYSDFAGKVCERLGIGDVSVAKKLARVYEQLGKYAQILRSKGYELRTVTEEWRIIELYVRLMNIEFGKPADEAPGYSDLRAVPKRIKDDGPGLA